MSDTATQQEGIVTAPVTPPAATSAAPVLSPTAGTDNGNGFDKRESDRDRVEGDFARRRKKAGPVWKALLLLASLRLTVILFALSMVLVFVGTLAQKDAGIWNVVNRYFRSFYVWVPFQIFFPSGERGVQVGGGFPFPGGWLIGTALLVNVVAAHIARFRYTMKRTGIVLIHAGIILLMVGELVTGMWAVEGNMTIRTGGTANFLEQRNAVELAFVIPTGDKTEHHVVIPESVLRKGGRIRNDRLPFDVEVVKYMVNSGMTTLDEGAGDNVASAGLGLSRKASEKPEVSGADSSGMRDLASAYVRLYKKGTNEVLDTYLVSMWLTLDTRDLNQQVEADGKKYDLSLRFKRAYKPYTVHLLEFHHDLYLGTNTPKNFSSKIRLMDPANGVDREVLISMNSPLRYQGETFFQASFLENDAGTVLQVVRNPGWLIPYISCILVTIGLIAHFGLYLVSFLSRRAAA